MRNTIVCLVLLLGACNAPEPDGRAGEPEAPVTSGEAPAPTATVPPSPRRSPSPSAAASGTPVATLAGEWRVAAIDGADFNEDHGIALSGSADELVFSPSCAGANRAYTIDALAFRARIAAEDRDKPRCELALPEGVERMWRAIDAATRVERTASNGVLLSGGGHSLLLFSQ